MSRKAQSAYTQYIKDILEDVRNLKASGYDVTECNRLLQSLVSAVLEQDYTCADYIINELNAAIAALRSEVPVASSAPRLSPVVRVRELGEVNAVFPGKYRHVVPLPPYLPPARQRPPTVLVVLLYSFLLLFVALIFTLINYVIRWS